MLVCPNEKFGTQIQKYVKELVGHEISPALYPILFDQIKIIVEKFFDQSGQVVVNDTNTQFIEHIIFIMKNVLEPGCSGKGDQVTGNLEVQVVHLIIFRIDFGGILLWFLCKYI